MLNIDMDQVNKMVDDAMHLREKNVERNHGIPIMKHPIKWIMYRIRWWKWFLVDGPTLMRIFLAAKDSGADADSRRILYDRADAEHLKKEPQPPL